jgi:glucokinase
MTTPELFARYRAGETKATRIVHQAAHFVGIGLANFVKTFDPEVIVVGGGVALHGGEGYMRTLMQAYESYLEGWQPAPVRLAKLGTEAGLLGAALTAAVEVGEVTTR